MRKLLTISSCKSTAKMLAERPKAPGDHTEYAVSLSKGNWNKITKPNEVLWSPSLTRMCANCIFGVKVSVPTVNCIFFDFLLKALINACNHAWVVTVSLCINHLFRSFFVSLLKISHFNVTSCKSVSFCYTRAVIKKEY